MVTVLPEPKASLGEPDGPQPVALDYRLTVIPPECKNRALVAFGDNGIRWQ